MDKASGIYYQNMTMKELEERRKVNNILIVPIGSTETHGPGLPSPHRRREIRRQWLRGDSVPGLWMAPEQ